MSHINEQVNEVEDEFEEGYDERFFTEDGELNEHFLDDWEDILEETDEGEVDLDYWKEEIDQEDSDALAILLTHTEPELPLTVIFAKLLSQRVGREALDHARARLLETFEKDEDKAIVRRLFEAADQLPQEGVSFVPLPDRRSDYDALIERVKLGEDAKRVLEQFAEDGKKEATTVDPVKAAQWQKTLHGTAPVSDEDFPHYTSIMSCASQASNPYAIEYVMNNGNEYERRELVIYNEHLTSEHLSRLARDTSPEVFEWVSSDDRTPTEALEYIIKNHKGAAVRRRIAGNRNTSPKRLIRFAKSKNAEMRGAVAANRGASEDLLDGLAKDDEWSIRRTVALNGSTTTPTLDYLARHDCDEHDIPHFVAEHKNTSPTTLAYLVKHSDADVRRNVAGNRNTPVLVLESLVEDEVEDVSLAAKARLAKLKDKKN